MDRISGYGVYQKNYYDNQVAGKKSKEKTEAARNDRAAKESQVQLSDSAKDLLKELQKTYGNTDFIVADYESDEEAAAYLSRGTKEYSVLIEPEILEEMAADEEAKEKYIGILEDATSQLADMADQLGDEKDEVTHLGVSIAKDGTVSYFAELEKMSEKQKERIEEARAEKKAEQKEAKRKETKKADGKEGGKEAGKVQGRNKRTRLQADTVEELLEQIKNVDWDNIKAAEKVQTGSRFDFSI